MELPVVLRRDAAGHSLLEETCKGFRTCARSAGCFLRLFSSVIYVYKFWCSWSFSTPAMEICSSFSVVLLSNWRCRERYKDCMKRFALSILLLLSCFYPGFPCYFVVGGGGVWRLTVGSDFSCNLVKLCN